MALLLGFIGVDRHSDPQIRDLTGANRDAAALWALFADTMPGANATLLTDEQATLSTTRDLLTSTLDAAGPDDTVILSFAGHGTHDHRLVTHDTQLADLVSTTLPMDELARRFKVSRAKAVVCFLDCCFSGGAPARVLEDSPIPRDVGPAFVEISGNGRVLFAACGVTEEALEDPVSQHGLFTQAIIALLQEGDTANSVIKLIHDTTVRVRADAARMGYVQTPVMFGHVEGEIAIPVLRRGTEYGALFPDISSVQVTSNLQDLVAYGISQPVIDLWADRFPNGLNELQLAAVNDARVLAGDSLLVVAPTSAGKTFIGELAAIRATQRRQKAVFLLPYKALVNEKFDEFSELYGEQLGLRVARCSGDYQDQTAAILKGKYDIAFFTYETFLGLALNSRNLLAQIGLVVLDEAQFLADRGRGITVELLLTHLISSRSRGIHPQLICLSAVIGGTNALDQWLGCRLLSTTKRPVPLVEGVIDRRGFYQSKNADGTIATTSLLQPREIMQRRDKPSSQDVIVPLVRHLVAQGEKVLVFRNTRGSAQGCAAYLADDLGLRAAQTVIDALPDLDQSSRSRELRHCLQGGTAFHSSDLRREEKSAVERAFRDPQGPVKVLVATSTVAAGVNTPASTVIIVETEFVGGEKRPYTVAEYRNMAGRAGRLGLVEEGKSILIADNGIDRENLFRKYVQGTPEQIKSSFDGRSIDTWIIRLLAQVQSVTIAEAVALLANTYGGYLEARADAGWQARTEGHLSQLIVRMLQNGLLENDGDKIRLTLLGRACGQSPLKLESALQLIESLRLLSPAEATPVTIMALVQGLPEADDDYTPIARGRGEPSLQAGVAHRFGAKIAQSLQRRAEDHRAYHARCKRALVLASWIDGVPVEQIEAQYTVNPFQRLAHGDVIGYADSTRYYLQSAFRIADILYAGQGPSEASIEALFQQLEFGIPEPALPLVTAGTNLNRGEYLALHSAGMTIENLKQSSLELLSGILQSVRAKAVFEWFGKNRT
jgi:helicase